MRLPHHERAIVPKEKILHYLLSRIHRDGRHKAAFFEGFGFGAGDPEVLAKALRQHAADNEVAKVETSLFGTRYVIEGILHTPDKRDPLIRAVWFIERGEETPRFVTAYPLRRAKHD